ncbi:MAG: thioredoxin-dependent thiol peroxidase [Alphaproteobacteria bacterium]|nr:thioredoxin-dependent thiol peroxidase [Alphaproteobacteria bacterium]
MSFLEVGVTAPSFTLKNQNNEDVSLADFAAQWIVLYFYPKALTPGCTVQSCALRDGIKELSSLNATVIGISGDDPQKLKKFEEKESLNFTLVGDPEHNVLEQYGTWVEKNMYGRKYMGVARMTYIINPEGKIHHVIPKVSPKKHLDDVLKVLKQIEKPSK